MKKDVFMSYFLNSLSSRGTPTSVAKMPRWMSEGLSPPPYEPIQPATESMSVPKAQ